ncbi:hypothetical protein SPSIL_017340 [Sporomusa silvacetica DSM 10669]|uniref:Uncharacterized protein n=1 Tax=Sporomusa silvacetica DSM 10669 TaxID=1123289 RepID=A0ABZ3IJK1_9FIRM|nr:hypothetical protein SPSIL_25870 [Sporomusa silvacetica DSM 10669]
MEILRERLSKCKAIQEILQKQMTVSGIIRIIQTKSNI